MSMERNIFESMLSIDCYDFDYSSLYPSIMTFLNSSRGTLSTAAIAISSGVSITDFSSKLVLSTENAVSIGKEYMCLPDYAEMRRIIGETLQHEDTINESDFGLRKG